MTSIAHQVQTPKTHPVKFLGLDGEEVHVIRSGKRFLVLRICAQTNGSLGEISVVGVFNKRESAYTACVNRFYAVIEERNRLRLIPAVEEAA